MTEITGVTATEILDSRGNPTVQVTMHNDDATVTAKVPSGASTGQHEAHELRDHDENRYHGRGVQNAVRNVNTVINNHVANTDHSTQEAFDTTLIDLDGTDTKSRLGANAILACSMAFARLRATTQRIELYEAFTEDRYQTPTPYCNILNGGDHAGNDLTIQEFMITPTTVQRFDEATRIIVETYHELKDLITATYGSQHTAVGDEGGFAPPVNGSEEALKCIERAAKQAGHSDDIQVAIDAAALEFYNAETDTYTLQGSEFTREDLHNHYTDLIEAHDIVSLEDPFHDDAFDDFTALLNDVEDTCQIVGDDLTVSNPSRVETAVEQQSANALLLKVNQIGTVTEARRAAEIAQSSGWNVMVSHRSGETADAFIADFAVGIGAEQIKIGAPCRSDRTSKYNRLLEIQRLIE